MKEGKHDWLQSSAARQGERWNRWT